MSLLPGPLSDQPISQLATETELPKGWIVLTQFCVTRVATGDDDEDYLIVASPLRYTSEADSRDQTEIDPEGTRMAIVWGHRTFDPVAAASRLRQVPDADHGADPFRAVATRLGCCGTSARFVAARDDARPIPAAQADGDGVTRPMFAYQEQAAA